MIILLSAGSNVKHETSSRQFKQVANMFALNDIPSLNVFHSCVLIWGWYGYINHYQRKSYIPKITEVHVHSLLRWKIFFRQLYSASICWGIVEIQIEIGTLRVHYSANFTKIIQRSFIVLLPSLACQFCSLQMSNTIPRSFGQ
jgi:hypothetical protein